MDKEQLVKDTVVLLNSNKTTKRITYWDIFHIAYAKVNQKDKAKIEFEKWKSGNFLPKVVEDIALDILTHKLEPKLDKKKAVKR